MKRIVIAVQLIVSLISTAADCIAVLEFFNKLHEVSRERLAKSQKVLDLILTSIEFFLCELAENIRKKSLSIKSNFETRFFEKIERIRWNKKYILI